jgi:hypothetical protein
MVMEIIIKGYPNKAKSLVDIWTNYTNGTLPEVGIDYVIFKNKRPKNPKTQNRKIAGLKAESISYLRDDEELVKMSVEDFIYLMAKCGVDIEMEEVE